jgi:hypothetical protein
MADLITRPIVDSDFSFCWSVYAESVKPQVSPLLKRPWIDADEEARFRSIWSSENAHMILCDGAPVGWFSYRETPDSVVIEHGYIRASHQKRRIGTILIDFIAGEAMKKNKNVEIEVLNGASAKTFFEKTGFAEVGTTSTTIQMMRRT